MSLQKIPELPVEKGTIEQMNVLVILRQVMGSLSLILMLNC